MDQNMAIGAAIVVLLLLVGAAFYLKTRRSQALRSRFGPEYERLVREDGDTHKVETRLHDREKRVGTYDIKPLSADDRQRYEISWRGIQAEFVDNPKAAVTHADALLGDVMSARGYPVSDFEQRSADLSVDHPIVVQNYRSAHDIAVRHARGEAGTEDLRQAMIHYRSLFDDLTHQPEPTPVKAAS